ncbi:alpha/beta fold hydrolase [Spirillospora sp. CA-255316]
MPFAQAGRLHLHYEREGSGEPLVLVHGSLDDLHGWDRVAPLLEDRFRVLRYDRRGHGASECPPGQGRIGEDVDDLAGILEALGHAPAHVVGHSYGATVALLLALTRPELCRTVTVHEPPLFALLAETEQHALLPEVQGRMKQAVELLTGGRTAAAVEMFVDQIGFGPGTWQKVLTPELRRTFTAHAHTWLDQARDPERLSVTRAQLSRITAPALVTTGDQGPPWYGPVVGVVARAVPGARTTTVRGAGHAPHLTHPAEFAAAVAAHARSAPRPGTPDAAPRP